MSDRLCSEVFIFVFTVENMVQGDIVTKTHSLVMPSVEPEIYLTHPQDVARKFFLHMNQILEFSQQRWGKFNFWSLDAD